MSTDQNNQTNQPYFNLERIYLKELSLEQPHAPAILLENTAPEVAIELNINTNNVQEDVYQIILTATITTTIKERVLYLLEAQQAGIFTLRNIPSEQLAATLEIGCASIVYPYLRAHVADLITRAGFAPIHLAEINFQMLYEKRLEQAAMQTTTEEKVTQAQHKTNGTAFTH